MPQAAPPSSLSLRRRVLLGAVLLCLVGGHFYCLLTGVRDRWPFSRYAMYTKSRDSEQAQQYVLVGVTADSGREVAIYLEWDYLRPLYRSNLHGTFNRMTRQPDSQPLLMRAAQDCLWRYERRREAGLHSGPPLGAMRIYHYTWRYAQADPITRAPTSRRLVAEAGPEKEEPK